MSSNSVRRPARDTGVGKSGVGSRGIIGLTLLLGGVSLLLLYSLMAFWPPTFAPDATSVPNTTAQFFGLTITLDRERSLLVMVALAGATGAVTHVLRSFYRYAGERHLVWSWIPSYLLTPFVGALLATLTYLVVRAGLITGGGAALGNPFGFAAIATLVGLFSAQAAEKLKQVFETIFAPVPAASEAIGSTISPVVASFDPQEGRPGTALAIRGSGLEAANEVSFVGGSSVATWDETSAVLRTTVPAGARTGPVSVVIGSAIASSSTPFTVAPEKPAIVAVGPGIDPLPAGSPLAAAVLVGPGVAAAAAATSPSNGHDDAPVGLRTLSGATGAPDPVGGREEPS